MKTSDLLIFKARWACRLACACLMAGAGMLAGCQTLHGLTRAQIKVLEEQGFSETDEGWTLDQSNAVLFAFDDTKLGAEGLRNITRLSKVLQSAQILHLKVVGYTDSLGDEKYNEALSKRRADAVVAAFVGSGFPRAGLDPIGMGERFPIGDNSKPEGRARNRHVMIIVVAQ